MKAPRLLAAVLSVAALFMGAPAALAAGDADQQLPRRIALPDGWQPEGITSNGRALFAGSLANGAIWRANPVTGRGFVLAPGRDGRVAVGVDYDRRRGLLWVAGGPTGEVRAHNVRTGRVVARYRFGRALFLNDLAVTQRGVFVTDSQRSVLAVVPLPRRGTALPPRDARFTLPITGDFELVPNAFNLNGIVGYRGWLLAVQSVNGQLFRINPRTGRSVRIAVTGANLTNGDGLERNGDTLYVVRNQNNRVVALQLGVPVLTASRLAVLTHRSLDVPTTAAVARGALWAVNARFGTPPTPDTPYWITRLPLR